MLAVHLDLTGQTVLIVGGGTVGRRKARTLLDAGANVRLVALEPRPADFADERLKWLAESFRPSHLDGVALVVTATNPQTDAEIARLARERGLWVNAASCPEVGTVHFPATITRGRLVVSIATSGVAPAFAAHLRERLEGWLPESLAVWIDLLDEARKLVRESVSDEGQRRDLAREMAALDGPALLAERGIDAVRSMLRERL